MDNRVETRKNEIYLSTGAFTGRINNRNPELLFEAAKEIECDGFELMIFDDLYKYFPELLSRYNDAGIRIKTLHADKHIGDCVSLPSGENEMLELFERNIEIGLAVGATKLVTHCWGMPPSDRYTDMIYERVGMLKRLAESKGSELYCENCVCSNFDPLTHMRKLRALYPDISFTLDTRCAEFHAELRETVEDYNIRPNIKHIHINDYKGGYKEWSARYPIPQPGKGQIDFDYFFGVLKKTNYSGTVTLEAPAMLESGVDIATLSEGLSYIRQRVL